MEISIATLSTHAWAASLRFIMTFKLKIQHEQSKLKWKSGHSSEQDDVFTFPHA